MSMFFRHSNGIREVGWTENGYVDRELCTPFVYPPCATCGHNYDDHEPVGDAEGYPHDFEQFCMGGDDCKCDHYEMEAKP